jgi:hypothetical protein
MTRRNAKLSKAYAYWRLAAKARKNGQSYLADHYQRIADQAHASWLRDREYHRRIGK